MNDTCFRNWSLTCLQSHFQLESQPGIIISGNYSSLRAARPTLHQVLPRAFSRLQLTTALGCFGR